MSHLAIGHVPLHGIGLLTGPRQADSLQAVPRLADRGHARPRLVSHPRHMTEQALFRAAHHAGGAFAFGDVRLGPFHAGMIRPPRLRARLWAAMCALVPISRLWRPSLPASQQPTGLSCTHCVAGDL